MVEKYLYIIRGLPGSGKSTLGEQLADNELDWTKDRTDWNMRFYSYAADDWFTDKDGNYNFVPEELPQAHEDCQARVLGAMLSEVNNIAVCNVFSQKWEAQPYFERIGFNFPVHCKSILRPQCTSQCIHRRHVRQNELDVDI